MHADPRVDRALHQLLRGEHQPVHRIEERPDGVLAEEHTFPGQTFRVLNSQLATAATAISRMHLNGATALANAAKGAGWVRATVRADQTPEA